MVERNGTPGPDILDNYLDIFNFGVDVDITHGRAGDDLIVTWGNNDRLYGDGGQDRLYGGAGNDRLYGGLDHDLLYDGPGNDTVHGDEGDDLIYADAGNDSYYGDDGNDTISFALFGILSDDSAQGYTGPGITVSLAITTAQNLGDFGKDKLVDIENAYGTNGNDRITGSDAANTLNGGNGNDRIAGGGGDDYLLGRDGGDTITGGLGVDTMECGINGVFRDSFRDRIVYTSTAESGVTATTRDIIAQFTEGKGSTCDRIDLRAIDADFDTLRNPEI